MKFHIQKTLLQDILQTVNGAVPNRPSLQVLNNFALRLEGNFLEVSATDLDFAVRMNVEVEGERDGSVMVNAHRLLELVRSLADPSVTTIDFDVEDYNATIRWSERGKANLTGFDADEFPPIPEVENETTLVVGASELAFLAEKTLFAVSTDTTRLALNGAYFEVKKQQDSANAKISLVATDGHRLGRAFIEQEGVQIEQDIGVILSKKILQYVLKTVPASGNVEIRLSQTHVLFSCENIQIISKLIEGPYPKYEAVIPIAFKRTVRCRTTELLNKIRSVISMSNQRTRQIRLLLEDTSLELSSSDPEVGGSATEALAVSHEFQEGEGPSFGIGFNGAFLTEILNMCKSEEVVFKLNTPTGASVMFPEGEDLNFSFLLMPLRLSE